MPQSLLYLFVQYFRINNQNGTGKHPALRRMSSRRLLFRGCSSSGGRGGAAAAEQETTDPPPNSLTLSLSAGEEETSFVDALLVHALNSALPRVFRAFRYRTLYTPFVLPAARTTWTTATLRHTAVNLIRKYMPIISTFRYDIFDYLLHSNRLDTYTCT